RCARQAPADDRQQDALRRPGLLPRQVTSPRPTTLLGRALHTAIVAIQRPPSISFHEKPSMTAILNTLFGPLLRLGLITQIAIGIVCGILLAVVSPDLAAS